MDRWSGVDGGAGWLGPSGLGGGWRTAPRDAAEKCLVLRWWQRGITTEMRQAGSNRKCVYYYGS